MTALFLSYRRADSPDTVKLIHERLKHRLRGWDVFYDHQSIPQGEPFPELLRAKLASATAVLVIIGPRWLEILKQRACANGIDHVREEVRLALKAGCTVVPVTVGNARMPSEADLADFPDLLSLLKRNGREVRPDPLFDADIARIVDGLKPLDPDIAIGTTLDDKYTLVAEIGEGGMGVVYLAQQRQPVQRTVAVKLIKPGMDSRDVLARFDAERQALAVMDHPNIARVLDAGLSSSGRPYFVMEHVKGVSITDYCDARKLSPQERINLFITVCNAVQHAHQKGIIHRDLKPSNVLVEVVDGKPVPKVIDFGLAKALGHKLTDMPLHTAAETRVGTLEYSAPEQAAGRSFDVDTRSDIYSLGVLLYELLTGAPPFTRAELLKVGEEEMRRVIRDVEPTKPSKKLSSSGELPAIAANRHLEPGKLTRLVQGDLDWIVMKCLEKENARRYETANQLGQELQRFLADEPVQAGPPSMNYRARKFVRRNKGAVLAATLVLLALVTGTIGTGVGLLQARQQRNNAKIAADKAEEATKAAVKAQQDAVAAAAKSEKRLWRMIATNKQLARIFGRANQRLENKGDAGALSRFESILIEFADEDPSLARRDPELSALSAYLWGLTFHSLKKHEKAISFLEQALRKSKGVFGPSDLVTLSVMNELGLVHQDRRNFAEALKLFHSTLDEMRRNFANHPGLAVVTHNLAQAYSNDKQYAKAIELYELALEKMDSADSAFGSLHQATLVCMSNLAKAHIEIGDEVQGISLLADFLDRTRKNGDTDELRIAQMLAEGVHELLAGNKHLVAEFLARESLKIRLAAQPDAWYVFDIRSMLGASLLGQKKYDEAGLLLKDGYNGMKQREKTIPPASLPRISEALERLVQFHEATGNVAEADRCRKELVARRAVEKSRPK